LNVAQRVVEIIPKGARGSTRPWFLRWTVSQET
jgi:hypothetical protein